MMKTGFYTEAGDIEGQSNGNASFVSGLPKIADDPRTVVKRGTEVGTTGANGREDEEEFNDMDSGFGHSVGKVTDEQSR